MEKFVIVKTTLVFYTREFAWNSTLNEVVSSEKCEEFFVRFFITKFEILNGKFMSYRREPFYSTCFNA